MFSIFEIYYLSHPQWAQFSYFHNVKVHRQQFSLKCTFASQSSYLGNSPYLIFFLLLNSLLVQTFRHNSLLSANEVGTQVFSVMSSPAHKGIARSSRGLDTLKI